MILYKKDWNKFPTAIVDVNTTNEHFLRTATLFNKMKVKNFEFILALYQPELVGVDPYSEDLTIEQKTAISLECRYNPWYFFREIARVPSGSTPLRFRCNRAIVSLLWSFFNHIDYSLIMPRQTGKNILMDALYVWLLRMRLVNSEIFLLTKNRELRKRNIKRIKETINLLPSWLDPSSDLDLDNTEVITCKSRGNLLKCDVGQPQADRARNTGRGETLAIVHVDEGPWIPNVHLSLATLLASSGAARDNSASQGDPYGTVFTTTAGRLNTVEGTFIHNLIYAGMDWNEILYDSEDEQDLINIVKKNCRGGVTLINAVFSHRQLGKTDEWLRGRVSDIHGITREEVDRDFLNIWTANDSVSSPFSSELLTVINDSEVEPEYIQLTNDRYAINWYITEDSIEHVMNSGNFIIGLDTGDLIGIDANSFVMLDIRSMEIICTCIVTEANLYKYSIWLFEFLLRYPRTTLIVENNRAQSIIDTISSKFIALNISPFTRMFNYVVDKHKEDVVKYNEIINQTTDKESMFLKHKRSFGFSTNGSTRPMLYGTVLQEAIKSTGHLIKDKALSSELRTLITKNGRIDHMDGGHDDTVIAWMLTHWFVKYSRNLAFYGIAPGYALSLVTDNGSTLSDADKEQRKHLEILLIEITDLKNKLIYASNLMEISKYDKILNFKVKETLKHGSDNALSMDIINEEIRVKRKSLRDSLRLNRVRY